MNNYNYSSYCQRPEEIDLSIYQLPGSPVHSPVSREQQFLQELRNLRTGIANNSQPPYRDVPIALSPSFSATPAQQSISSLHRTFSDSNVIITPPHLMRNGREDPHWMTNPPPPFSSYKPQEPYNSMERSGENATAPAGRTFFKCASPTPWQSSDNLVREDRSPRQRFFSPGPKQEPARNPTWEHSHWERATDDRRDVETSRNSGWENFSQNREHSRQYEQSHWEGNPEVQRDPPRVQQQWDGEQPRMSRRAEWEYNQNQQLRARDSSISRNPDWEGNSNWAVDQRKDWQQQDFRQEPPYRPDPQPIHKELKDWPEQDPQHRQQVQRDLLQEIRQHRQQQAARAQPSGNQFDPIRSQDHSLSRQPEPDWRQTNTPLTPLYENRVSHRSEWDRPYEDMRNMEQQKNGYQNEQDWNSDRNQSASWNRQNYPDHRSYPEQDTMTRSQEYGRGGFFAQAKTPVSTNNNRAMTEPPRNVGILDRAMQNRVSVEPGSHSLGPKLEMDVTVTHHSSYRNGDGKNFSNQPQRHSYAGTFSEYSRSRNDPQYSQNSYPRLDNRPKSLNYEVPDSIMSSPTVSPPLHPIGSSLPTSPIQRSASLRYNRNGGPTWELDSIYGMAEHGAQRSFLRNQEVAQRSTVTTPMYGRATLNERQPERASVERTTAVVNPMVIETPMPSKTISKHTGILLNPNESRKTSKRRVMFLCDREETDDFYQKNFGESEAPAHVRSYDAAVEEPLTRFSSLSEQIGGDVAAVFQGAMELHRNFLWKAASQAKPSADNFQKLFKPLLDSAQEVTTFKDSNRKSPYFNHLNVIADGIPALGWVTVEKTPAPYIKEAVEAATFYLNRILKDFKDKDQKHVDWVKAFQDLMKELQTFVKQTHTTGLVWNSAPGNAPNEMSKPPPAMPSGPAGGPPPPPPPPPANLFADIPKSSAPNPDKAGREALFAELNKGEGITSGLKKVTSDMQTHKNPNLRSTSTVPSGTTSSSPSSNTSARPAVQKPPRIELENGKQWSVEFYNGNRNIIVEITDKKQSVYIYKCDNSVVQVKGKCNSVALDSCKKTAVVLDGVVAQCETVNCQSVQIQTMGEMPTLSIQKTDGCQVYLSESSKDCEIVTSKSSEMNVLVPEGADGDFIELPLPEQFKTVYKGGKLITTVSDI